MFFSAHCSYYVVIVPHFSNKVVAFQPQHDCACLLSPPSHKYIFQQYLGSKGPLHFVHFMRLVLETIFFSCIIKERVLSISVLGY